MIRISLVTAMKLQLTKGFKQIVSLCRGTACSTVRRTEGWSVLHDPAARVALLARR